MNIKDCFKEDFTGWLLKSNNPNVDENECLKDILDILLREPLADYFWYTYPVVKGTLSDRYLNSDSRLVYSLPKDEAVPSESLRVDGEKVKAFLRDYKIESILNK
jgi:hypothetical protein